MRLLLTSGGVTNPSIEKALVGLLGKPVAECTALAIPSVPPRAAGSPASSGPTCSWWTAETRPTPRVGDPFVTWRPEGWSDETLGVVDFSIYPHAGTDDLDQQAGH